MSRRPAIRATLAGAFALCLGAGGAAAGQGPATGDGPTAMERCAFYLAPGAVAACREAVLDNPDSIDAKRNLARSLINIGDFEAVVEVYRAIARARPDDADALADLGGALGFVRRYAEAVGPMEKVIRLRPGDVTSHRAAAVIYAELGRDEDAFRATLNAARLGDTVSMYDLVGIYRDGVGVGKDTGEALKWAEKAADGGHLGALGLVVRVYLEGLLGEAVDEARAEAWAWKLRNAERGDVRAR